MSPRIAVVMVCAFGLLTACGGDGGSSAGACGLLAEDEAAELLGVPTDEPAEDTDRSRGTYCTWHSTDSDGDLEGDAGGDPGEGDPPYFVSVEDDSGASAVRAFEGGRLDLEDPEVADVEGLGTDAYFDEPHGLQVRDGDRVFSTYVGANDDHPLSDEECREIERRAAEIILERLGS